ncbi:hypothetical protein NSPZN2_10268 [Nitrospira defluvii]|uniref:Uncharacterized protein n=1 Tax=Nitrospira defluvii TaxID=330214 RepID=A0ABM8QE15_9BACT|nr:hypothetical protein NSPZN2_10268 [Nitrospira defluvii]
MAATRAEPVEFQAVSLDHKAVFCRDLLLQPLDLAVLKLDDRATAGADEMVVMAFMGDVVVLRLGAEVASLGNPSLAKEVQRAVDRREPQMRIFLRKLMIHCLGRHVLLSKERRQDQFSLASQFQLMLRQMLTKHVHFFKAFAHRVWSGLKEAH